MWVNDWTDARHGMDGWELCSALNIFFIFFFAIDITTISKMSTLEYKYGDTERGCTMFESLVSTYPRKVDVWSVYIDAVIKTKDYQRVR